MSTFFVNYPNFTPIVEGLKACGYTVIENVWYPSDEDLRDCHGYLICMYKGIKRPLQFLGLHARLQRHGIPLITWNRDGPWHRGEKAWRLWLLKRVRFLDIYATHTLQDSDRFAPLVMYLPNAAWVSAYNLAGVTLEQLRDPNRYCYDVSFFGKLDAEKYPEIRPRAEFLSELGQRLSRLGVSTCFRHSEGMSPHESIDFVQRSRINLNYGAGCDDGPEKSWGLPERCYGVPACGGFLLSDYRRHAEDDFVLGKEWVHFSDLDDAVAKIRYYLDNFHEARRIAEAAHGRVMKDHGYIHRARSLVEAATVWRKRVRDGNSLALTQQYAQRYHAVPSRSFQPCEREVSARD